MSIKAFEEFSFKLAIRFLFLILLKFTEPLAKFRALLPFTFFPYLVILSVIAISIRFPTFTSFFHILVAA